MVLVVKLTLSTKIPAVGHAYREQLSVWSKLERPALNLHLAFGGRHIWKDTEKELSFLLLALTVRFICSSEVFYFRTYLFGNPKED